MDKSSPPQAPSGALPRGKRRTRWWVVAAAFVVGVVAGVILLGLVSAGAPAPTPFSEPSPAASVSPEPSSTGTIPTAVTAQVNQACLRALNDAQDTYGVLTGISQINGLDFQQLDDLVRRLQPIEPRLRANLDACRVDTSVNDPSSTGTPLPSAGAGEPGQVPSPSGTATR